MGRSEGGAGGSPRASRRSSPTVGETEGRSDGSDGWEEVQPEAGTSDQVGAGQVGQTGIAEVGVT